MHYPNQTRNPDFSVKPNKKLTWSKNHSPEWYKLGGDEDDCADRIVQRQQRRRRKRRGKFFWGLTDRRMDGLFWGFLAYQAPGIFEANWTWHIGSRQIGLRQIWPWQTWPLKFFSWIWPRKSLWRQIGPRKILCSKYITLIRRLNNCGECEWA